MAVLLVAAAVPVIAVAAGNAHQNYMDALEQGRSRVVAATAVSRAAFAGVLVGAETLVQGLVLSETLRLGDRTGCEALLERIAGLRPSPGAALAVSGADGTAFCGVRPTADGPARAAIVVAARFRDLAGVEKVLTLSIPPEHFGEVSRSPPGGRREAAAVPRPAWLIDRAGNPLPVADTEVPPPDTALLALMAGTEDAVVAAPAAGDAVLYAGAPLPGGLRVVVGQPYGPVLEAAWGLLLQRLAELAAFLLVCLAAILVGADLGMVRPLRSLAARVSAWTPGTPFLPARATTEPREVSDLERAFAVASVAIAEREAELRAALEQRDAAMAEIHHRVKNNLQVVSSLLNLQANRIADPVAHAEFLAARNRVRALATLHRHLYLQQSFTAVSLRPFLDELGGQQFQSRGEVPGERLALRVEAAELSLSADQAVTVALFVTEAVGNALEHAFPDDRRGAVTLLVAREGEDAVVAVGDDGVGLPERPAERGGGLGLKLMDGFARQLGGTLRRAPGPGTGWSLRFPLRGHDAPPRLPSRPADAAA